MDSSPAELAKQYPSQVFGPSEGDKRLWNEYRTFLTEYVNGWQDARGPSGRAKAAELFERMRAWLVGEEGDCSNYRIVCCGVGMGSLHRLHPMPDYTHSVLAKVVQEMLDLLASMEQGTSTDPICPEDHYKKWFVPLRKHATVVRDWHQKRVDLPLLDTLHAIVEERQEVIDQVGDELAELMERSAL